MPGAQAFSLLPLVTLHSPLPSPFFFFPFKKEKRARPPIIPSLFKGWTFLPSPPFRSRPILPLFFLRVRGKMALRSFLLFSFGVQEQRMARPRIILFFFRGSPLFPSKKRDKARLLSPKHDERATTRPSFLLPLPNYFSFLFFFFLRKTRRGVRPPCAPLGWEHLSPCCVLLFSFFFHFATQLFRSFFSPGLLVQKKAHITPADFLFQRLPSFLSFLKAPFRGRRRAARHSSPYLSVVPLPFFFSKTVIMTGRGRVLPSPFSCDESGTARGAVVLFLVLFLFFFCFF